MAAPSANSPANWVSAPPGGYQLRDRALKKPKVLLAHLEPR